MVIISSLYSRLDGEKSMFEGLNGSESCSLKDMCVPSTVLVLATLSCSFTSTKGHSCSASLFSGSGSKFSWRMKSRLCVRSLRIESPRSVSMTFCVLSSLLRGIYPSSSWKPS